MIDFSSVRGRLGDRLRRLLRILPYRGYIPILQGAAKGMLWKRGAGGDGYWLGSYEAWKQNPLAELLSPSSVFYDIGAYAGFFALLGCKKGAKVYAFEPDAENLKLLREHLSVNKCEATILDVAVSDRDGIERFKKHESATSHKLSADGEITVNCRALDSLAGEIDPPTIIKIDAEGAERKILLGAKQTIERYKPIIFLEGLRSEFEELLPNYSVAEIHSGEYLCTPRGS